MIFLQTYGKTVIFLHVGASSFFFRRQRHSRLHGDIHARGRGYLRPRTRISQPAPADICADRPASPPAKDVFSPPGRTHADGYPVNGK